MFANIITGIQDLLNSFYIPHFRFLDFIEILIIVLVLYFSLFELRKTRAWILIKSFFVLLGIYLISFLLGFNAITVIFEKSVYFFIMGIILVLQPELRKIFEFIAIKRINPLKLLINKNKDSARFNEELIDEICDACRVLSRTKTGALIVIEGDIPLKSFIDSGIPVDAIITKELLINTFEHNTPLHDGAVIISNNKMAAATCYLPLSKDDSINKAYGTRHRAAIGMSEETDAFTIVVSEETGHISASYLGVLYEDLSLDSLKKHLEDLHSLENILEKNYVKGFFKKNINLKVFSIFAGVISWLILMNVFDPIISIRYNNIPITVLNEEIVQTANQSYNLSGVDYVNVIVKDKRSVLGEINKDDIKIFADFKDISVINTIPLTAFIDKAPNADIRFGANNSVVIQFEDVISRDFKIDIVPTGTASSGFYVHDIKSNIESVKVTGPKSIINTIKSIEIPVDINGINENFNSRIAPIIYDINGDVITKLEIDTDYVYITGTVYKTKIVDLTIQLDVATDLDYEITNFYHDLEKVEIAASDDVLDRTEMLFIVVDTTIDKTKVVDGVYKVDIPINNYIDEPYYLVNKDDSTVLTIEITNYIEKEMVLLPENISINNLNKDFEAIPVFDYLNIKVWVPEDWKETIQVSDISPKIDFKHAKLGINNFELTFSSDLIKLERPIIVEYVIGNKEDTV